MNKIVTIYGSMKFESEMRILAEKLELNEKFVVIQCTYSNGGRTLSEQDIHILTGMHYKKIDISDAIYVVNVGGYIGESTQKEIAYARSLNKEVLFLEPAKGSEQH